MKLLFAVLLIALASSGVLTLPARNNPQDDAEVVSVPQRRTESESSDTDFHDFKGVIDTGSGYPFLQPNPSPFNIGFFNSFDDIFRRLRTRLWPVVVDSDDSEAGSGESPSDAGFPLGFGLRTLTPLDAKDGNTTSTVKIVDGHRVEINETVYGNPNSLVRVRLVNVRPLESGEDTVEGVTNNNSNNKDNAEDIEFRSASLPTTSAPPKRSEWDESSEDRREPLEKKSKDNEVRDIDGLQSTTTTTTATSIFAADSIADSTDNRPSIMADLREKEMEQQQEEQLLATQDVGTMAHNEETEMSLVDSDSHNAAPDAEAIENFGDDKNSELLEPTQQTETGTESESESESLHREREELESSDDEEDAATPIEMSETFNSEWETLDDQIVDANNDLNNHIDIYEKFVPIDLSNDIAVNDAAAANPDFPYNPDAELIEVPAANFQTMPKFEKLSLMPPTNQEK